MIAPALEVSVQQREASEVMARSSVLPHRQLVQTRGLLLAGGWGRE